jgi:hypothetical protein
VLLRTATSLKLFLLFAGSCAHYRSADSIESVNGSDVLALC